MAAGAVDVMIAATPDEVWAKVGDFAGVAVLFPAIESFRLEGDDRIIGMSGCWPGTRRAGSSPTRSSAASPSTVTPPPFPSSPTGPGPR